MTTRRLTAETRKAAQEILTDPAYIPATVWLICRDALHDLDVADAEIATLREKCEKIPGYKAEAEAHRMLLMEKDAEIARLQEELASRIEDLNHQVTAAANLLARIHRDGGHYIDQVGWKQACLDAEEVVLGLRSQQTGLTNC